MRSAVDDQQLQLFRARPGDMPPRDAQDLMSWPFFSLAKTPRVRPIDFHMGEVTIRVEATLCRLRDSPVVDNPTLRDCFHQFVAIGYVVGGIEITRSSGTTGRPAHHIKSFDEEFVFNAAIRARIERAFDVPAGSEILDLSPRVLNAGGEHIEPVLSIDYTYGMRSVWRLRRYQENDKAACDEYSRFGNRPFSVIYGAPSRIHDYVSWCEFIGSQPRIPLVISSFEELTPSAADLFSTFFSAEVVNLYGSMETGFVGWSRRPAAEIIVEEDMSIVEILRLDSNSPAAPGEIGRIVVTSLKSWVMPVNGSMMVAWIEIHGARYKTRVFDLSGSVAVQIPTEAIQRHGVVPGARLKANVFVRAFKEDVRIPNDIVDHLDRTGSDLSLLPSFERRQALLYFAEAASSEVRTARINALVEACRQASGRQKK